MGAPQKQVPIPALELIQDRRFEAYRQPARHLSLLRDAMAGLIVALVAIPLGIGFAVASGLQPEQGVMAGALAGILGGLFGGSKYQVYGPTAAFIPLLSGIVAQYDVPFLILASMLAGALILLMGMFKLGRHFARIPFSVTVGFTVGIALSIALGQLPDALGSVQPVPFHTLEKLRHLLTLVSQINPGTLLLAVLSFLIIRLCYQTSVFIPGPLLAIIAAIALDLTLLQDQAIPLLADKFGLISLSFFKATLPALGEHPVGSLVLPVVSIVFIASLESLLSARMADRLAKEPTPFCPERELIGQGLINMFVPLLNGFPCTGAFARTATNIKAGATSPAASLFQGGFILLLLAGCMPFIGRIPMACLSGLLIYVAVNMIKLEELRHVAAEGRLHLFLMGYTAVVTVLTDLFIAVASGTALYYGFMFCNGKGSQPASGRLRP